MIEVFEALRDELNRLKEISDLFTSQLRETFDTTKRRDKNIYRSQHPHLSLLSSLFSVRLTSFDHRFAIDRGESEFSAIEDLLGRDLNLSPGNLLEQKGISLQNILLFAPVQLIEIFSSMLLARHLFFSLFDGLEIDVDHFHRGMFFTHVQKNLSPRIDEQRMSVGTTSTGMFAHLGSSDDETLILDRPSAQKNVPMTFAGQLGKGTRITEELGTGQTQQTGEFNETKIVTLQTMSTQKQREEEEED